MKKLLTLFFSGLYYGFVIVLIAAGGALLAMQTPVMGGTELKIVRSGSMEPAIMTGAVVVIRPADVYNVGDVITFGADTKTQVPTTHRVVEKTGEGSRAIYHTKGDANETPDGNPVKHNDIIGKVAFSAPYAGFVLDFARQPLGFVLLIAVPAAAVILDELWTIWREFAKRRRGNALADSDDDEEESEDEDDEAYDEVHDEDDEQNDIERKGNGRPHYTIPAVARVAHTQVSARATSRHAPVSASRMHDVVPTQPQTKPARRMQHVLQHASPHVTVIPPRPLASATSRDAHVNECARTDSVHAPITLDGIITLRYARR